jgi:hypothetical protein
MPPKTAERKAAAASKKARRQRQRRNKSMQKKAKADQYMDQRRMAANNVYKHIASRSIGNQDDDNRGMNLCLQMAMPYDNNPQIRLPTNDSPLVATSKFRYMDEWVTQEVASTNLPFGLNKLDYAAVVYGQPSLLYIDGPWKPSQGTYKVGLRLDDALTWAPPNRTPSVINETNTVDQWFPVANVTFHVGNQYRGNLRDPIGVTTDAGPRYIWMSKGEQLFVHGDATYTWGPGSVVRINVYRFVAPSLSPELVAEKDLDANPPALPSAAATSPGTYVVSAPEYGWYAVEYSTYKSSNALPIANMPPLGLAVWADTSVSGSTTYTNFGIFRLKTVTDMWNGSSTVQGDPVIGQKVRRTGCSLLVSNTSPQLIIGGNVLGARVDYNTWNNISAATLGASAFKYRGLAKNGCYTYLPFTTIDEGFRDCVDGVYSTIATVDLLDNDLLHVLKFEGLTEGCSLMMTCDVSLEFQTSSMRYGMQTATYNFNDLILARRINNSSVYFFENPLHPRDILRLIRSGWEVVRKNANLLARGVSAMYPELAPVALPMGRMFQR